MAKRDTIKGNDETPSSGEASVETPPPAADAASADVTPKMALASIEAPKIDVAKVDAPKIDIPTIETTNIETPSIESPRLESPSIVLTSLEAPSFDPAKIDMPRVDEIHPTAAADFVPAPGLIPDAAATMEGPPGSAGSRSHRFPLLAASLVLAASLTLLPALLMFTGRRIGRIRARRSSAREPRAGFWLRWVGLIQRRPAWAALASTALLLAFAAPALGLHLGASDAGNDPTNRTTREAYDLLATGFGSGFNGPLQLAVQLPAGGGAGGLTQITTAVQKTAGVASVAAPQLNPTRLGCACRLPDHITAERGADKPRQASPPRHLAAVRLERRHGAANAVLRAAVPDQHAARDDGKSTKGPPDAPPARTAARTPRRSAPADTAR